MKNLVLISLFMMVSVANTLQAATPTKLCYGFTDSYECRGATVEALFEQGHLLNIIVKDLPNSVVLFDEKPTLGEYTLRGRCSDSQGGRWSCNPDIKVPLYTHFLHAQIHALFFRPNYQSGAIFLQGMTDYTNISQKACL